MVDCQRGRVAIGDRDCILERPHFPGVPMRRYWPATLFASALLLTPRIGFAQEQAGAAKAAATADVAVGTAIADRALTGAADTFKAADTKMLYCLSKVSNAENSDVEHVWYHNDQEVARVKLHVGGS